MALLGKEDNPIGIFLGQVVNLFVESSWNEYSVDVNNLIFFDWLLTNLIELLSKSLLTFFIRHFE